MGKIGTIEVGYEMSRQPHGQYTSDKMSVRATVIFQENENPDLMVEIKNISGMLKLACEKRIMAGVKNDQN